tara:strand:- start:1174 stop:1485 length:312 start_codon:yes stop_codon:yes gene_type:complete
MLDSQKTTVNSQLDKLERISNQISLLVSENDYEKINHLDRLRKKIINDMKVKEIKLNENNKKTVMKLISQNKGIISEYKQNNSQELSKISNSKKCAQAYLATL